MGKAVDYETAKRKSAERFRLLIMPELKKTFRADFISIEENNDIGLFRTLDIYAGIDIWMQRPFGLRGIASRIQESNKSFDTFTIRKARESGAITEYEKRKNAIALNYLYPYYTLQAYVAEGENLISYAICKTTDLFNLICLGHARIQSTGKNQIGQAEFFVVDWDTFKSNGINIIIVADRVAPDKADLSRFPPN